MRRPLLISLACILLAIGCQLPDNTPPSELSDTLTNKITQSDVITDLDTAMINLKGARSVALTDALCQVWTLDDVNQPYWSEFFMDSVDNIRRFPGLALFKDHSVTENARYTIKMGVWQLDKKKRELALRFDDGSHKTYAIRQFAVQQMKMGLDGPEGPINLSFTADALVYRRPEEDPFYPTNNQWRIKPKTSETDKEIRTRLKAYVHFYSLFFHDNRLRQAKKILFQGLPACLVWYNGGIGMSQKNKLDHRWVDCFYSEKQAMDGYEILEAILAKHDLKWPEHPTSWIKQTYEVLDQIYDKL